MEQTKMEIKIRGIRFTMIHLEGGKVKFIPIDHLTLDDFLVARKYMCGKGAIYERGDKSFNFDSEPNFDDADDEPEPTPKKEVVVEKQPAPTVAEKKEVEEKPQPESAPTSSKPIDMRAELMRRIAEKKRELAESKKTAEVVNMPTSTSSEEPVVKEDETKVEENPAEKEPAEKAETPSLSKENIETLKQGAKFEIFPIATMEEVEEFINATKIAVKNRAPEHQTMLDMILNACREDEELRRYVTHKDYLEMWAKGGFEHCQREKKLTQVSPSYWTGDATAEDIFEDVIAQYKKPVEDKKSSKKDDGKKNNSKKSDGKKKDDKKPNGRKPRSKKQDSTIIIG